MCVRVCGVRVCVCVFVCVCLCIVAVYARAFFCIVAVYACAFFGRKCPFFRVVIASKLYGRVAVHTYFLFWVVNTPSKMKLQSNCFMYVLFFLA